MTCLTSNYKSRKWSSILPFVWAHTGLKTSPGRVWLEPCVCAKQYFSSHFGSYWTCWVHALSVTHAAAAVHSQCQIFESRCGAERGPSCDSGCGRVSVVFLFSWIWKVWTFPVVSHPLLFLSLISLTSHAFPHLRLLFRHSLNQAVGCPL